jgi:hypothetical protein
MTTLPATPAESSHLLHRETSIVVPTTSVIGAVVYSRDRQRLGCVKDANADCMLIDARFAFDYWLSTRAIAQVMDGRVQLGIDKRQVGEYLVDRDCLDDFASLPSVSHRPVVLYVAP